VSTTPLGDGLSAPFLRWWGVVMQCGHGNGAGWCVMSREHVGGGVDGQGCGCEVGVVRVLLEVAGRVLELEAVR
jgi:hypothetical protein